MRTGADGAAASAGGELSSSSPWSASGIGVGHGSSPGNKGWVYSCDVAAAECLNELHVEREGARIKVGHDDAACSTASSAINTAW